METLDGSWGSLPDLESKIMEGECKREVILQILAKRIAEHKPVYDDMISLLPPEQHITKILNSCKAKQEKCVQLDKEFSEMQEKYDKLQAELKQLESQLVAKKVEHNTQVQEYDTVSAELLSHKTNARKAILSMIEWTQLLQLKSANEEFCTELLQLPIVTEEEMVLLANRVKALGEGGN